MKHDLFITRTMLIASLMLSPLILPVGSLAEKPAQDLKRIAAESVEDTLKACLKRIPVDASAGQRQGGDSHDVCVTNFII